MNNIISLLVYMLSFGLSYGAYHIAQKNMHRKKNIYLFVAIIIPVVLLTFRRCGTDFHTYIQYYYGIKIYKFSYGIEPLWTILNLFSPSERGMLFLSGFCFMIFSAIAIEINLKEEKRLAWKILLLVFLSFFINIMRQMIACSIVLIAYAFYKKGRKFWFVFFVCLAALFHKSALFMMVLPFLCGCFRYLQYYDIVVYALSILLPFLSRNILNILQKFSWYSRYLNHEIVLEIDPKFIICMLPAVIIYYISGVQKKKAKDLKDAFHIFILGLPLQTLSWRIIFLDRMSYYNFYFMILLLPLIISQIQSSKYKLQYKRLINIWLIIFYFFAFYIGNITDSYPYIQ